MKRLAFTVLVAVALGTSCAGNPAVDPTPAPGPVVTRHTTPVPVGVPVVLR